MARRRLPSWMLRSFRPCSSPANSRRCCTATDRGRRSSTAWAWARTYLKGMGLLTNSKRGVWSVTETGQTVTEDDIGPLHTKFVASLRKKSKKKSPRTDVAQDLEQVEAEAEADWKDELLETLLKMSPTAFERLAQRLLRESGFSSATVTGRSGDGGIDGQGVYQISLLSFPVFFQCKRYTGSVGAGAVRDFRGAMAGRGEKGLLITTGTFTSEAQAEANRDGAPPIDLIDGAAEGVLNRCHDHRTGGRGRENPYRVLRFPGAEVAVHRVSGSASFPQRNLVKRRPGTDL